EPIHNLSRHPRTPQTSVGLIIAISSVTELRRCCRAIPDCASEQIGYVLQITCRNNDACVVGLPKKHRPAVVVRGVARARNRKRVALASPSSRIEAQNVRLRCRDALRGLWAFDSDAGSAEIRRRDLCSQ